MKYLLPRAERITKLLPQQDVVKLEVIPEDSATVLHNPEKQILTNTKLRPTIEIQTRNVCIKISNDIDPMILLQVLRSVAIIQKEVTDEDYRLNNS